CSSFLLLIFFFFFFFSSRRRHTRSKRDWSSDVCSSDLVLFLAGARLLPLLTLAASACGLLAVLALSSPYRLERLTSFSNPWADRSEERRVGKECSGGWGAVE